jgi:long-chain acyl-CoA synthetase
MINYGMLINCSVNIGKIEPRYGSDEYLSFIAPAWIAEQGWGIGSWLYFGSTVNFPEEPETVQEDIKEIGPQFLLFGSRQWESLMSMVQVKMIDAGFIKKTVFNLCMPIGYKIANYELNLKIKAPLFWRILNQAANWICFRPIRDFLGIQKTRIAWTGGALTGTDLFRWFRAIGVSLREAYGLSEATPICGHGNDVKVGTVGKPVPGSSVKISTKGEILLKVPIMFKGYYKKPEATAKALEGGWFKSGDAGFVDEDGHLTILDRVGDMLPLKGGAKYSPSYIENSLKFSPYVKDVIVVGGEDRDYPVAIIDIDFDNIGKWAERNRIPYTTFADLSQKAQVYDLILKDVERVNKRLPSEAQLHKYALLHKEFDPDEGELTRTRKLRRKFMEERYSKLIEASYSGVATILVEAEVKYQDGRVGKIATPINIKTVE